MSVDIEMQVAIKSALEGAPGLAEWPVLDGALPGQTRPYISLGPSLISEAGGKAAALKRHRFALTLWASGGAVSALKPAMAEAEMAVLGMAADLPTARIVRLDYRRSFTRRDVGDDTVRGEIEFEAITQTEEA